MYKNFDFFEWSEQEDSIPLKVVLTQDFERWRDELPTNKRNLIDHQNLSGEAGDVGFLFTNNGRLSVAILVVDPENTLQSWGPLSTKLKPGTYRLTSAKKLSTGFWFESMRSFAFGCYHFDKFKAPNPRRNGIVKLIPPKTIPHKKLANVVSATFLVRDMVNMPANHMGPDKLEKTARIIAEEYGAEIRVVKGRDLLKENYPLIYAVGKAGEQSPRLVDMQWGPEDGQKITLVGKGVTFDTGGLNIKGDTGMLLMKKDMGGAAHVLGVARMIMDEGLDIRLRVLIPIVENAISRNAFRPSDIICSRKGLTVEITNTDAEGRLILADALALACEDDPEIIFDMATLTGAARVALGADLPAFFANDKDVARKVVACSHKEKDPLWFMPLHQPYRSYMKGSITDLVNSANTYFAGTITAALFLEEFIKPGIPWVHVDTYAFNHIDHPGRPKGGEAMGMRTIYRYILETYTARQKKKQKTEL